MAYIGCQIREFTPWSNQDEVISDFSKWIIFHFSKRGQIQLFVVGHTNEINMIPVHTFICLISCFDEMVIIYLIGYKHATMGMIVILLNSFWFLRIVGIYFIMYQMINPQGYGLMRTENITVFSLHIATDIDKSQFSNQDCFNQPEILHSKVIKNHKK